MPGLYPCGPDGRQATAGFGPPTRTGASNPLSCNSITDKLCAIFGAVGAGMIEPLTEEAADLLTGRRSAGEHQDYARCGGSAEEKNTRC